MKRYLKYAALVGAMALVVAACSPADGGDTTTSSTGDPGTTSTTTADPGDTTTTTEPDPGAEAIKACQVTDTGGIDDRSFNQTAWKGVTDAQAAGLATSDSTYLESTAPTDYEPNIQSLIDAGCDLIITVGFLLGDDTETMANANPDQYFQIIDYAYDPVIPNVEGAVFATVDAAFLSGYLAAGMTESGVVATYGGIPIPGAVTDFMDGFVYGVRYYNEQNDADVTVLGWNPESQTGSFTGNFDSLSDGRDLTQGFVNEGADIILPVAGPVGEGSAALANELGDVWVIGVDADWFQTMPQYASVILSSVLKGLDVAVLSAIRDVVNGDFEGRTRVYTIAEDGVGLGPVHDDVPQDLRDELAEILEALQDGSLTANSMAQ